MTSCSPCLWPQVSKLIVIAVRRFGFALLFGSGFALMLRLPLPVGHPVDEFPSYRSRHFDPPRFCCIFIPVCKAISAEARKIHKIDVLHFATPPQMLDEPPQDG